MTNLDQIEQTIVEMVSNTLKTSVTSGQTLIDAASATRQLDSMAILELLVGLEEHFQVELIDHELDAPKECRNVHTLAQLVFRKLHAAGR